MAAPKDFRLYTLDAEGHISKATLLEQATDEEAVEAAQAQARAGRSVELWHRCEQVAFIDADDPDNVERRLD